MSELEKIEDRHAHGGRQLVLRHQSTVCACPMTFALYLPPNASEGPVPLLTYLSGLTCTHANVMEKGEYRKAAAQYGVAVLCPDTSPRGDKVANDDNYFAGQGAGFYLDATQPPYSENFNMATYVKDELPQLVRENFPVSDSNESLFGHSMGGHGALTLGLKHPDRYVSVSAFAPICAASRSPWGEYTYKHYLGDDQELWKDFDAVSLIENGARRNELLVDQGLGDEFLESQLMPNLLIAACEKAAINLTYREHEGYDHSYYFISTWMTDHVSWHAKRLLG